MKTNASMLSVGQRHTPVRHLHGKLRNKVGQPLDWLRIYIVNEEEILLGGNCATTTARQRVLRAVRELVPDARLRSAMIVGDLSPGLQQGSTPPNTRRGR